MTFGYTVLGFGSNSGAAPLSGALNFTAGGEGITLSYAGGSSTTSSAGDLDVTVIPAGGAGSYTYTWSLGEIADADNKWAVSTTGTTNNIQYNTARFVNSSNLAGGDPPPQNAIYQVACLITDGASDTHVVAQTFTLELA
jgi:FlaG/FlaF family flagellin (archaellin)